MAVAGLPTFLDYLNRFVIEPVAEGGSIFDHSASPYCARGGFRACIFLNECGHYFSGSEPVQIQPLGFFVVSSVGCNLANSVGGNATAN